MLTAHAVNRAFGAHLREARAKANLSQSQLSTKSGIGRTTIANMELGTQAATIFQIFLLADALEISPESLLPDYNRMRSVDADLERLMRYRQSILAQ